MLADEIQQRTSEPIERVTEDSSLMIEVRTDQPETDRRGNKLTLFSDMTRLETANIAGNRQSRYARGAELEKGIYGLASQCRPAY